MTTPRFPLVTRNQVSPGSSVTAGVYLMRARKKLKASRVEGGTCGNRLCLSQIDPRLRVTWHVDAIAVEGGDEILLRLRRAGLSYNAIAIACRELLGWTMTERQARIRLLELGAPKNPNKKRNQVNK